MSLRLAMLTALCLAACGAQTGGDNGGAGAGGGGGPGFGGAGGGGGSGGDKSTTQDDPNADEVPKRDEGETGAQAVKPPTNTPVCGSATPGYVYGIDTTPVSTTGMASAVRVRELLSAKIAPRQGQLRVEDVFHYYHGDLGTLTPGTLQMHLAMAPRKIAGQVVPNQADLFLGVQAGPTLNRPHVVLTLLVDTSLSMQGEGLSRAQAVVRALGNGPAPGDRVTLMTTDMSQSEQFKDITDPKADMSNLADTLALGVDETVVPRVSQALGRAKEKDQAGSWNRVLLIGDGEGDGNGLPLGELAAAASAPDQPILTGSIGVGPANRYHDRMMFLAARDGHGPYVYVDSANEAEALFGARFDEIIGLAHGAVSVHVDLPWFMQSLDPPTTPGSGDVNAGHDLSPRGLAAFLFHVGVCDLEMLKAGSLPGTIDVRVQYSDPLDPNAAPVTVSVDPFSVFSNASPEIDKFLATQAYFDAISGGTADRITDALGLLTPLSTAEPNGPFAEMQKLTLARQSLGVQ